MDTFHEIPDNWNPEGSGGGGGGGKGGGGGSSRPAIEEPNTLRSNAVARVLLAYSEGPTGGLTDWAKSVYFDKTPLQAADGTYNFSGVELDQRTGLPNQPHVPGFSQAENTIQINQDLKVSLGPVVRQISSASLDAVRIIVTIPTLQSINTSNGDQTGTSVTFRFEVRDDAVGVWEDRGTHTISGKCTSPYQRAYRLQRPSGSSTWSWRAIRITADSESSALQNSTIIAAYVEIEESRQTYPNTAYVAIKVNTAQFGNSIPQTALRVNGVLVPVPSNYNQNNLGIAGANVYNGVWNGNWKYEATNNPIWHFLELITNPRYGMGIPDTYIDRFALYTLARYCDGVDANGHFVGVPDGKGGVRPRFTIQTQLTTQEDALNLIQAIASTVRGMAYWGAGVVVLNADMPKQSVKLVAPENVVDGKFVYSGTEIRERYTEANVTYNNPDEFWEPDVVTYKHPTAEQRYPRNVIDVTKFGCANRAEALMFGKWIVDSSLTQTETVNFRGGVEFAALRPGDLFEVADPNYQGCKYSGRVIAGSTTTNIVLDQPVTLATGQSYVFRLVGSDGQTIHQRNVQTSSVTGQPITNLAIAALPEAPTEQHMWIIAGAQIKPRQFTCVAVREEEDFSYEVVGINYDPNKFLRVEQGIVLPPEQYSRINIQQVLPPSNMRFAVNGRVDPIKGPTNTLNVAWDASPSPIVIGYEVYHRVASGDITRRDALGNPIDVGQFRLVGTTDVADIDIDNIGPGIHEVQVTAINLSGRRSLPIVGSYTFDYGGVSPLFAPQDLFVKNTTGTIFSDRDCTISWVNDPLNNTLPSATLAGWRIEVFEDNVDKTLRRSETILDPALREWTYTYTDNINDGLRRNFRIEVRPIDTLGRAGAFTGKGFSNPPPAVPGGVNIFPMDNWIRLTHNRPQAVDAVGTLIWLSPTPDFVPSAQTLAAEGIGRDHDIEATPVTTYHLRFAIYDTFSRDPAELNISSEYVVTTLPTLVNPQPPAIPSGLTLTSASGGGVVSLRAQWTALAQGTFTGYELELTEAGGTPTGGFWAGVNNYAFTSVRPVTQYTVRIRGVNGPAKSDWSAPVTHTTVAASSLPSVPTGLSLSSFSQNGVVALRAAWDTLPANSFTGYELRVSEAQTISWSHFQTTDQNHTWQSVRPITEYVVSIRAINGTQRSAWSNPVTITTAQVLGFGFPTSNPSRPNAFNATASFRSVHLTWTAPTNNPDQVARTEIWEATVNDRNQAVLIGSTTNQSFTRGGLGTGVTRWYWVRNVGINGNTSDYTPTGSAGTQVTTLQTSTADYQDLSIVDAKIASLHGDKITANTINGNRIMANTINADRIQAFTTISNNVIVANTNNTTIGGIAANALDPATRINANATTIEPGKIAISGQTTLANWRSDTDETKINGGAIAANSIEANSIRIGNRNVSISGIVFEPVRTSNTVSWSGGFIRYIGDNGQLVTETIPGNTSIGTATPANPRYFYWIKGTSEIQATTDAALAYGVDNLVLATYSGGTTLIVNYGGTMIDGDTIITGTLKGNRLEASTITGDKIVAGTITGDRIAATTITGNLIAANTITGDKIQAGTINGDRITAGTLIADRIAAGTITGDRLMIGGVNFERIAENAITNTVDASAEFSATATITVRPNARVVVFMTFSPSHFPTLHFTRFGVTGRRTQIINGVPQTPVQIFWQPIDVHSYYVPQEPPPGMGMTGQGTWWRDIPVATQVVDFPPAAGVYQYTFFHNSDRIGGTNPSSVRIVCMELTR